MLITRSITEMSSSTQEPQPGTVYINIPGNNFSFRSPSGASSTNLANGVLSIYDTDYAGADHETLYTRIDHKGFNTKNGDGNISIDVTGITITNKTDVTVFSSDDIVKTKNFIEKTKETVEFTEELCVLTKDENDPIGAGSFMKLPVYLKKTGIQLGEVLIDETEAKIMVDTSNRFSKFSAKSDVSYMIVYDDKENLFYYAPTSSLPDWAKPNGAVFTNVTLDENGLVSKTANGSSTLTAESLSFKDATDVSTFNYSMSGIDFGVEGKKLDSSLLGYLHDLVSTHGSGGYGNSDVKLIGWDGAGKKYVDVVIHPYLVDEGIKLGENTLDENTLKSIQIASKYFIAFGKSDYSTSNCLMNIDENGCLIGYAPIPGYLQTDHILMNGNKFDANTLAATLVNNDRSCDFDKEHTYVKTLQTVVYDKATNKTFPIDVPSMALPGYAKDSTIDFSSLGGTTVVSANNIGFVGSKSLMANNGVMIADGTSTGMSTLISNRDIVFKSGTTEMRLGVDGFTFKGDGTSPDYHISPAKLGVINDLISTKEDSDPIPDHTDPVFAEDNGDNVVLKSNDKPDIKAVKDNANTLVLLAKQLGERSGKKEDVTQIIASIAEYAGKMVQAACGVYPE